MSTIKPSGDIDHNNSIHNNGRDKSRTTSNINTIGEKVFRVGIIALIFVSLLNEKRHLRGKELHHTLNNYNKYMIHKSDIYSDTTKQDTIYKDQ